MLRKFLVAALVGIAATSQVNADILFTDGFDYADGALSSNAAWSSHSGTAEQIQVAGGEITLADSQTEDVNRLLGQTISTGTVFAAFDFSVNAAAPAAGGDYEYFAHFGTGGSTFTARMDIVEALNGGDFSVGIGSSNVAESVWGADLVFGTNYRAVIGFDGDTGIASLWIDPASEGSTSIVSSANDIDVDAFYFRQSNSTVNETITIDNLIVVTAFSDLTAVPEPTSFAALTVLSLVGLAARRRRQS